MQTKYKVDDMTMIVHKYDKIEDFVSLKNVWRCLQLLAVIEIIYYTKDLPVGALVGGSIFTFGAYKLALI